MSHASDTSQRLHNEYAHAGGVARVFSAKISDYVASRPDYPSALLDEIARECALEPGHRIADVGAGTGLLTRDLLARGYRVTAVEPNAEMRDACNTLLGQLPNFQCVDGTAESMPLADQSVDLVTAATAFHWFNIEESRREILRVLAPHGKVALIWNDRLLSDPLHVVLDGVFNEFGGAQRNALIAHEDRSAVADFFGATTPSIFSCPHVHRLGASGLISLVLSRSYMPPRESVNGLWVADNVRRIFDDFAHEGLVDVNYTSVAYIGRPKSVIDAK